MAKKLRYFVPALYEAQLWDLNLSFTPAVAVTTEVPDALFKIPGFIITSSHDLATEALKNIVGVDSPDECRVGNQIYRLCSCKGIKAELGHDEGMSKILASNPFTELYLSESTLDFAWRTGREIHLGLHSTPTVVPFEKDGTIHLVMGARPPGECVRTNVAGMCGVEFDSDLHYHIDHTAGRGTTVTDSSGIVVGQIVDDTFYLYLDLRKDILNLLGIKGAGARLFERVLALLWNAYFEARHVLVVQASTPEELRDVIGTWTDLAQANMEEAVTICEENLRSIERLYAEHLGKLKNAIALRDGIVALLANREVVLGSTEEQRSQWEKLLDHPSVASIAVVGNGINLTTRPVVLSHEGKRYPQGSYVLRMTINAELFVWGIDSPHPQHIPHPHVGEEGTMCFGNLALTLRRVGLVDRNYPEAFRLALELLTEGYDPSTTIHPLTEWPEEQTDD